MRNSEYQTTALIAGDNRADVEVAKGHLAPMGQDPSFPSGTIFFGISEGEAMGSVVFETQDHHSYEIFETLWYCKHPIGDVSTTSGIRIWNLKNRFPGSSKSHSTTTQSDSNQETPSSRGGADVL